MTNLADGAQDISLVVWVGILALLFLAVALYEGWLGGGSGGASAPAQSGVGVTGDF
jgi:hypothetical protein